VYTGGNKTGKVGGCVEATEQRTQDQPVDALPRRRLRRAERREEILAGATRAFAATGFAATNLDDVAEAAGVSKVLLYRHFESKSDLYRAVLDRADARLDATIGTDDYDAGTIPALVQAASEDPDGFRLLFRYAAREPEFRDVTDALTAKATDTARRHLAALIPDAAWVAWASELIPTVTVEAVIAWLDAGQPQPEQAAERVGRAVQGVFEAALPLGAAGSLERDDRLSEPTVGAALAQG
jgi:AcrR family transcriptional regulator